MTITIPENHCLVWSPDDGVDRDDGILINAREAKVAAERYAREHCDYDAVPFDCIEVFVEKANGAIFAISVDVEVEIEFTPTINQRIRAAEKKSA